MFIKFSNILFLIFVVTFDLYSQQDRVSHADFLFENEKYSAAQALYQQIISDDEANELIYFKNAKCAYYLFASDATLLYKEFLFDFPYSYYRNNVYEDLAFLYIKNQNFYQAIDYFFKIKNYENFAHIKFNIAYSYFCIDSLNKSQYFFSEIINTNSKYSTASQYYYSHIAYKKGLYKTALNGFNKLIDDKNFGSICPYYISQIYFFQKKYNELIVFLKPIIDSVIESRKLELNRLLAESYYQVKKYDMAIKHFNYFINNQEGVDPNSYFLIGHSYYLINNYSEAIKFLEMVNNADDSTMQYSSYILGASYLEDGEFHYALQAFKKASTYASNLVIQEESLYNYAKLSYQLDKTYENNFLIFEKYLDTYFKYRDEIESLVLKSLQSSTRYKEAFDVIRHNESLNIEQKSAFQKLSFYLGVIEYNQQKYKTAIEYFKMSNLYKLDSDIEYYNTFWLADCFYQLEDYQYSIELYNSLSLKSPSKSLYYNNLREYNLAYAYFKKGEHEAANKHFKNYEKVVSDSMRLHDTYLRIADCFFMNQKYSLANTYYQRAIKCGLFDIDYAIYKSSQCLNLLQSYSLFQKQLLYLIKEYNYSSYYNYALIDLANYFKYTSNDELAIKYYDKLLLETDNTDLSAQAFLSKGMIYFKNNKVNNAIEQFLNVIKDFQQTVYFNESLIGLQAAYSSIGNIDIYLNLIDSLPQISITQSAQDSLVYNTAFLKFSEEDYKTSNIAFDKYIDRFYDGIFIDDAIFHNAISSLNLGDTNKAIVMYKKLSEYSNLYQSDALIFLARLYFQYDDKKTSSIYYSKIRTLSVSNYLKREAIIRLMYINEFIDSTTSYKYAKEVINLEKKDDWLTSRAKIIIARHYFNQGNYPKSKIIFSEISKLSFGDEGAEAKYYLSYLTFLDDSLDLAEKMIFELIDQYSNDYFIASAFILLSDIYSLKSNIYQSKATLESVIENCEIDEIVNIASKKWEDLVQQEIIKKTSSIESYIEVNDDDIEYLISEFDFNDSIYKNYNNNINKDSSETKVND